MADVGRLTLWTIAFLGLGALPIGRRPAFLLMIVMAWEAIRWLLQVRDSA